MNLSDNLKRIRKENNLSQEDLAEKLGVSRQSVSKWESGAAYPEMDKVIQLCKMFDLNIDELLNKNVNEVKDNKQSKININKYIDDFLSFVTKTINMFSDLTFKSKMKCLIEQVLIILFLVIVGSIIGSILESVFYGLISFLPEKVFYAIFHILKSIYILGYLILSVAILVHIFKTRYLDYYTKKEKEEINTDKTESKKEPKNDNKKEDRVIIRDPNDSGYGFISGLLKVLLIFVKVIVAFFGISVCSSLIGFTCALALSFLIVKSGLLFLGVFLILLALIITNIIVIVLIFDFIINRKPRFRVLITSFIISLILFGTGSGLSVSWIKDIKVINSYDEKHIIRDVIEYNMEDDLYLNIGSRIKYIESDNNNIKIEYDHTKYIDIDFYKNNNMIDYNYGITETDTTNMIKDVLSSFNEKVIFDPYYLNINVYTTKENIEKLKNNYNYKKESECSVRLDDSLKKINELSYELEEKNSEIESLKELIGDGSDE